LIAKAVGIWSRLDAVWAIIIVTVAVSRAGTSGSALAGFEDVESCAVVLNAVSVLSG